MGLLKNSRFFDSPSKFRSGNRNFGRSFSFLPKNNPSFPAFRKAKQRHCLPPRESRGGVEKVVDFFNTPIIFSCFFTITYQLNSFGIFGK